MFQRAEQPVYLLELSCDETEEADDREMLGGPENTAEQSARLLTRAAKVANNTFK